MVGLERIVRVGLRSVEGLKGTETVITISCSEFVLVNQPPKDLSPTHGSEVRERRARIQKRVRRSAAEAAVGPARF